ncbi:ABC transporter ATP-binding protein [Dactylosporangium aurantiacum]|uniref:ABC transporter ATP-binding protein n=1 Tax=Dactylosporangium aurantiacum TaxID=35754 RepID=A0A9Q9ID18_9ACTN|nr:ABC transporter ATP-binding protein [Dactylosporangium aurantiacum]MDG6107288.1 ABC transporter ATP-binding protein [Dactylosporangium aurantiacum]UWZ51184.1 ABC transporter ATP-binding protein [Dactylosporangium aurantiacum]
MPTVYRLIARDLLRHHPGRTALGGLGLAAATGCGIGAPMALAAVVDSMSGRGPAARPVLVFALLLAGALAGAALASRAAADRASATTARHRGAAFVTAMRVPPYDTRYRDGELLARCSSDAETPARIAGVVLSCAVTTMGGLAAFVLLCTIDWRCAAVVAAELIASWFVVRAFLRGSAAPEAGYRAARGALADLLVDAHRGARTIAALGTQDRELRRVLAPLGELRAAGRRSWRAQRDVGWRMGLLDPLLNAAVLAVAGLSAVAGRLSPGSVLAVLLYSQLTLMVLEQVDLLAAAVHALPGAGNLAELLTTAPPDPGGPVRLPPGPGHLAFERVRLTAATAGDGPGGAEVTCTIAAGTHVAVVGRSGSGKSRLAALVGRLADPAGGRVLLDGHDLRTVPVDDVRAAVAYAFEEPNLFGATLRAAIAAGADLRHEDVVRAAREARADAFVRRLPAGYDTPPGAAPLSGGERQRLGLARAFARPARVLVLDDAMSSLDTATAAEVAHAVRDTWHGRTTLVVTHRAATAAAADLVLWLDAGRVRGYAPHRTLWSTPGYRALFGAVDREPAMQAGPA